MTYLFFELSRRPDVVAAIRAEIEATGEADPTWEHLRNMKYLNWVLKEALRLNPPVAANQREAIRDTVLPRGGGPDGKSPIFVPKGTNFRYLPWSMQRRKDLFGEDAEEFRPERWEHLRVTYVFYSFSIVLFLCDTIVAAVVIGVAFGRGRRDRFSPQNFPADLTIPNHRYEYLPFNAGPRICIGQQFALTQMALITFRLLQTFKTIARRDDRPPIQKLGINLSMLYGCHVSMTPA